MHTYDEYTCPQHHRCIVITIMFINPKVWNALRLSPLDENEIDYLMFILFMVVLQVNVGDLQVVTKGLLYEMLLEEHCRIQRQHPHGFAALAADHTNAKACAIELGFPKKYVQHHHRQCWRQA